MEPSAERALQIAENCYLHWSVRVPELLPFSFKFSPIAHLHGRSRSTGPNGGRRERRAKNKNAGNHDCSDGQNN